MRERVNTIHHRLAVIHVMLSAALQAAGAAFVAAHRDEYEQRVTKDAWVSSPIVHFPPPSASAIARAIKEANEAYDRIVAYVATRKGKRAITFDKYGGADPHEVELLVPFNVIGLPDYISERSLLIIAGKDACTKLLKRLRKENIYIDEESSDTGWTLTWHVHGL